MITDTLDAGKSAETEEMNIPQVLHIFGQTVFPAGAATTAKTSPDCQNSLKSSLNTAGLLDESRHSSTCELVRSGLHPKSGWTTYNFEVEEFHTYVAGGLRVHNLSILDFVPADASNVRVQDTDRDGAYDVAVYDHPNGVQEILRGRSDAGGNTYLVDRTVLTPRTDLLGAGDSVIWLERFDGVGRLLNKEAASINYAGGRVQGEEIGRTLGSALGSALGSRSTFAQVGSATIAATLLQNLGELLQKGVHFSLLSEIGQSASPFQRATNDTFHDLGRDLLGNAQIQINNSLSSILVAEIADALDLSGFERGLFSTVGNTVTNQVLANIGMMTGIVEIPQTVVRSDLNLLYGFNYESMAFNVVNSLGGYFGSQLGNTAVRPKSSQSALFGSAASAVGSYVGTVALSAIPFVGPLIGAFAGQTLGNLVGNALWDDDRRAHYTVFTAENGTVQYGFPFTQDGASLVLSEHMASTISGTVNSFLSSTGTSISYNQSFNPFRVGWYVNSNNQKIMFAVDNDYQVPFDLTSVQGLITSAVNHAVSNSEISGSDLFQRRAYHVSRNAGLAQLGFDLQVASDYKKYINNVSSINSIIAQDPKSIFSAGWVATLQRARELGLHNLEKFNAMEYLASNSDLQINLGLDEEAATRHFIYQGISENRKVTFNSLEYLAANPGLASALGGIDIGRAAIHFMNNGRSEGRAKTFNRYAYLASHPDLWIKFGEDSGALYRSIIEQGARPITFDSTAYLSANADLKTAYGSDAEAAAKHYIFSGRQEGRRSFWIGSSLPDTLYGNRGDDKISGNAGADTLYGFAGQDLIYGNNDGDLVYGNEGADTLYGGQGADVMYGGRDADMIRGNTGSDTIFGNDGSDLIFGNEDSDIIYGNGGNDIIYGNQSLDTLYGGGGSDILYGGADSDIINGNLDADTIFGNAGSDILSGNEGSDIIYGNEDNDVIYGNQGADTIYGGSGSDRIFGGQEDDVIIGGIGDDVLVGGAGADRYVFGASSGSDIVLGFNQSSGDKIVANGQGYSIFTSSNGNAIIRLSGGGVIELPGVGAHQINGGAFG